MGNSGEDNELAQHSQESDTSGWCPYCGVENLDDKQSHVESEHMSPVA